MTIQSLLAEIKERLAKATPGPWTGAEGGPWGGQGFIVATTSNASSKDEVDEWFSCRANTESAASNCLLMSHAPADLARLIQALEIADAALKKYQEGTCHNCAAEFGAPESAFELFDLSDNGTARKARNEIAKVLGGKADE